ncbi:MAG: hypothetical protein Ct9H90mP16_13870 [Candidatus Poseidoniales archaeon]|nr:MAG: hypothetical protein Ct9H90mP16_13870 [Candidatus Poseidoniales archaeon]
MPDHRGAAGRAGFALMVVLGLRRTCWNSRWIVVHETLIQLWETTGSGRPLDLRCFGRYFRAPNSWDLIPMFSELFAGTILGRRFDYDLEPSLHHLRRSSKMDFGLALERSHSTSRAVSLLSRAGPPGWWSAC